MPHKRYSQFVDSIRRVSWRVLVVAMVHDAWLLYAPLPL